MVGRKRGFFLLCLTSFGAALYIPSLFPTRIGRISSLSSTPLFANGGVVGPYDSDSPQAHEGVAVGVGTGTGAEVGKTDPIVLENWSRVRVGLKKNRPRIPVLRYEDQWVCVNKPAGITVHPHSQRSRQRQSYVLSTLLRKQLARKVFPVHRLDHRTSGAILFAFDSETCRNLHEGLALADKEYVALLRGAWKGPPNITVDQPLNVTVGGGNGKKNGNGTTTTSVVKECVTEFRLLSTFDADANTKTNENENEITSNHNNDEFRGYHGSSSLVLCRPKTGRTHQIRRHAYMLGHPIIGDTEHGDSRVNRWWRVHMKLDRLALHCLSIDFGTNNSTHFRNLDLPSASTSVSTATSVVAPIPNELKQAFQQCPSLWEFAVKQEPRLELAPFDDRGGTFGRHYQKKKATLEQQ